MPIAAIPNYLHESQQAGTASPGLRFGLLLPLWGEDHHSQQLLWDKSDTVYERRGPQQLERPIRKDNKASALHQACALTANDQKTLAALRSRQAALAHTLPAGQVLVLDALASAPFSTGLGNEHPLENGFAFLNPYGLPYLPGSGIKGVLRQAARELASGEWGEVSPDLLWTCPHPQGEPALSLTELLLGREAASGSSDHFRGVLTFWDCLPQLAGHALQVEVMTPHQSHYYQQKNDSNAGGSCTPHDSGQPIPICYLTVPAGSLFAFYVQCDLPRLARLAPEWAAAERWQVLLTALFEHAFAWLGFGAKTAVGYGAMQIDTRAASRRRESLLQQAEAAKLARLSPAQQAIAAFVKTFSTQHEAYPSFKENPNGKYHGQARTLAKQAHEIADWSAGDKLAAAEAIELWLPLLVKVDIKDERKKLKLSVLKGQ